MATPSSPKPISPITTIYATASAASPTKKPPPTPWTHEETINLIQAYQEKWYALKRGQLRANQWEEVAVIVAALCGYEYNEPSKTAIQCRHKMEKLRRRYRNENHRLANSGVGGRAWEYFGLMDQLEKGPMPISARPLVALMPFDSDGNEEKEDDDEEDEREYYSKSKSINYILNQRSINKRGGLPEFSREQLAKRLRKVEVEEEEEEEGDHDDDDEGFCRDEVNVARVVNGMGLVSGLAAEMKAFAERFIGMENLKMEMMKETERCRLEMENKRIEMIVKSQQRIVDSIGKAFGFPEKMKISHEI